MESGSDCSQPLLRRQAGHGHLADQHQVWKLPDIRGADPILAVSHLDMKNAPVDLVKVELDLSSVLGSPGNQRAIRCPIVPPIGQVILVSSNKSQPRS